MMLDCTDFSTSRQHDVRFAVQYLYLELVRSGYAARETSARLFEKTLKSTVQSLYQSSTGDAQSTIRTDL